MGKTRDFTIKTVEDIWKIVKDVEDPAWYKKELSATIGFAVSIVRGVAEGITTD